MPDTVAEHWLVWPVWMLVEAQETLTAVMVGDTGGVPLLLLPPPQPDANMQADKTQNEANHKKSLDN